MAFLLPLKLANIDVKHVPIFCPKIIGIVLDHETIPVVDIACSIPIVAAELCTKAVISHPLILLKMDLIVFLK